MSLTQVYGIWLRMTRQIVRSKWTIPYLILFPIFFIAVYWVGFSSTQVGEIQTFELLVVNEDGGLSNQLQDILLDEALIDVFDNGTLPSEEGLNYTRVITEGFSHEFIYYLNTTNYPDADLPLFDITFVDRDDVTELLEERRGDIALFLPQDFSQAVLSLLNRFWYVATGQPLDQLIQNIIPDSPVFQNITTTVDMLGDPGFMDYQIAEVILDEFVTSYFDVTTLLGNQRIELVINQNLEVDFPVYSTFDIIVPGLIIFGILIQPSLLAIFLCEEFNPKNHTFDRVKISGVPASSYVLAVVLVQIPVMLIQTVLLFGVCLLVGFEPLGGITLAFLVAISLLPFVTAMNFIAAAFLYDEDTVGSIYGWGAPILGFMSGAFTPLPHLVLFKDLIPTAFGSRDFLVWDILPSTAAVIALRNVLLWDFDLSLIATDMFLNLGLSTVFLVFSIWIFVRKRFGGIRK